MNYLVTGFQRSGTSGMMRALQAGGMAVSRTDEADEFAKTKIVHEEGYDPNPNGYYELHHSLMNRPGWLEAQEERVFKLFLPDSVVLPADGQRYRVIFCWRDPWEIRESWMRTFGQSPPRGHIEEWQDRYFGIMEQRRDFEVVKAPYHRVIQNPVQMFKLIKIMGWPIDVEAAAATIDPNLYRNRYPVFDKEDTNAEGISLEEVGTEAR